MSEVKIYHNPQCGTSRNTLALIRQAGIEPQVIFYLQTPPSRDELLRLMREAGVSARQALRDKGELYDQLQLSDPQWSDDQLVDFMIAHPLLINRPWVVTPKGTRLCRPAETVLELI